MTQTETGTVEVHALRADLSADVVLKGPAVTRVSFGHFRSMTDPRFGPIEVGHYGLYFLKSIGGRLEPASRFYPSLIAVRGAVITDEADVLARVVRTVGAVIRAPNMSESVRLAAVETLAWTRHPAALPSLRQGLSDPSETIRIAAAAVLLGKNDTAAISVAEPILSDPGKYPPESVQALRSGIDSGLTDERAVPFLSRLMTSTAVETRRAAAWALSQTNSSLAMPALAMALTDVDRQVRYAAVSGLALISQQPAWHPSIPTFGSDEQHYLAYWLGWAKAHGLRR